MRYDITLTFNTDILGTVPLNKKIYEDYIATKDGAPPQAVLEAETIATDEKGKTGFHRLDDGTPAIYDYVIKGYLKDACSMLSRMEDSLSKQVRAFKKVIDGLVFVEPRLIPFQLQGTIGELQRPLRAQTAQGERVALAFSETIPAGSKIHFELLVLDDKTMNENLLHELFDYGQYRGLGQWRNGGWGKFHFVMTKASA